jgi:hypothetical protein
VLNQTQKEMDMKARFIVWSGLAGLLAGGCAEQPMRTVYDHVDLSVLLERMTNVNTFAEAPLGNSFLVSSYDRTGGNQDWAIYSKPAPGDRITIFEAEGPGYVSRFWIASFAAERWLFFFDGEDEPRLDLARDELFGDKFPFAPPVAGKSGGGRYSLLPIPFSKSLRIEMVPTDALSQNTRNYFQINYTKLDMPPGSVDSFPHALSTGESNLVRAVNSVLDNNGQELQRLVEVNLDSANTAALVPGASMVIWEDEGEGVLSSFSIRIDEPSPGMALQHELLRCLRLQFYWDGLGEPSVDVPLGDFFCNPWYFRAFSSLPLGRVGDTFVCRFPMPYRKGARCVIRNTSAYPVTLSVGAEGDRESAGGLNRTFHAAWRASTRTGRPLDFVEVDGSGHYIGCFLSAIGQDGTWTILEGDEILRPDEGVQPAQFGTGLEDYFNGAYYYTSLFDLPLHGLIEKGAMRTDQYRLHMLDAVAFDKSFKADIEFGHGNQAKGYLSSLVYWYADKSGPVPLDPDSARLLSRPADRFELHGLMAQLFLLERAELFADAAARMDFFSARYSTQPWCDLLKVRALGYREKTEGFAAVRGKYDELTGSTFAAAAQAAKDALWVQGDASNALLGIHALAKYRLKLDGTVVAEGEGLNKLTVERLQVMPGEHVWEVELAPNKQGSFFSLCLRNKNGDMNAAGDWEAVEVLENPGKKQPKAWTGRGVLPNMTIWAFEPNAHINMQSAPIITLWSFWDSAPVVKRIVLRKHFTVDADGLHSGDAAETERSEDELRAHAIN